MHQRVTSEISMNNNIRFIRFDKGLKIIGWDKLEPWDMLVILLMDEVVPILDPEDIVIDRKD